MEGELFPPRYPVIIFPTRQRSERQDLSTRPPRLFVPAARRQRERITPQFRRLTQQFNIAVRATPEGVDPELVLVIEIAGSVQNFIRAVSRIEGLEWIGEWESEELFPDEDFHVEREDQTVRASLFLMFSNRQAMREVLSLWQRHQRNPDEPFPHGLGRWKNVFRQLRTIRWWDENDRIAPELLSDWEERLNAGDEAIPFEAELWFFQQPDKREAAEREVRQIVQSYGGEVMARSMIEEIDYHAVLGSLPAARVRELQGHRVVRLFKSREIMYLRPASQAFVPTADVETELFEEAADWALPMGALPPTLAVLDGMPIENHPLLAGRLIVDDPDGFAADVSVADRVHGTAMCSLAIYGDLSNRQKPLSRPIYVRPILKPEGWGHFRREAVPENMLFIDLLHRAVRRLFAEDRIGNGRIYIINISVGDCSRVFARSLSPCAKLLDWLAWRYQVLFIVSAGNHGQDIDLQLPAGDLERALPQDIERELLRSIDRDSIHRRLLSPAETVNGLTVGAMYDDGSVPIPTPHAVLAYQSPLPSPYNAHGFGYRRAVKPDVLVSGGRILVRERLGQNGPEIRAELLGHVTRRPGQYVAAPPRDNALAPLICCSRGTSNAAALASHSAAELLEDLKNHERLDAAIPDEFLAVCLKALVVHGASWSELAQRYEDALTTAPSQVDHVRNVHEYVAKYLGYGLADFERSIVCTQKRVTLLGYGTLSADTADIYTLPLPPTLSGQAGWRRLVVTLAWMTPINPRDQRYRRAHLWLGFPDRSAAPSQVTSINRSDVHSKPSMRGTVQHEVFETEEARVFRNNAVIRFGVNCRADAGALEAEVPYAVAVTFEVADQIATPVYQEISNRIRQPVPVRPR